MAIPYNSSANGTRDTFSLQQPYESLPVSIFENLLPHRIQRSLVVFCLLSVLPPLSAQTAKELMTDACYNERQQHKNDALWASQVECHTAGHIYLEEEIETGGGPIHRLVSVDGHEPSLLERKQDDDRLRKLMQNPKAQQAMKKNRGADQKNVDEVHALSGIILIDLEEKRLAPLAATLTEQVDFGYGVLGQLKKGGIIEVKQIRLSPGIWRQAHPRSTSTVPSFSSRQLASSRMKLKSTSSW